MAEFIASIFAWVKELPNFFNQRFTFSVICFRNTPKLWHQLNKSSFVNFVRQMLVVWAIIWSKNFKNAVSKFFVKLLQNHFFWIFVQAFYYSFRLGRWTIGKYNLCSWWYPCGTWASFVNVFWCTQTVWEFTLAWIYLISKSFRSYFNLFYPWYFLCCSRLR